MARKLPFYSMLRDLRSADVPSQLSQAQARVFERSENFALQFLLFCSGEIPTANFLAYLAMKCVKPGIIAGHRVLATSDAHGHDDIAITVRFVGERAHLAGGLFVF